VFDGKIGGKKGLKMGEGAGIYDKGGGAGVYDGGGRGC